MGGRTLRAGLKPIPDPGELQRTMEIELGRPMSLEEVLLTRQSLVQCRNERVVRGLAVLGAAELIERAARR